MNKEVKKTVKYLKAVSDPTRFFILKLLQHRAACVCELTAALGLAQPTVSRHLRILEEAEMVKSTRRGLRMDYRLDPEGAPGRAGELVSLVSSWHEDDSGIAELRRRLDEVVEGPRRLPSTDALQGEGLDVDMDEGSA